MKKLFAFPALLCAIHSGFAQVRNDRLHIERPYLVSVSVANADSSAQWYVDKLDFDLDKTMVDTAYGVRVAFLKKDDFHLELIETPGAKPLQSYDPVLKNPYLSYGYRKLGFLVPDVVAVFALLRSRHCNIMMSVYDDQVFRVKYFFVRDVDGNVIQFFQKTNP